MTRVLFILLFLGCQWTSAQVGPRSWQDHLSINYCNSVTKRGTTIFASYYNGLIYFDEQELSPVTRNKSNGLSDAGVRLLRTNPHNNKVLVVYDNCNIDIIDGQNNIVNYPDFRMKIISGKKIVNEVTFHGRFAYLACGFGIVVFDTEKLEVLDTYIIGPNATELEVLRVSFHNNRIFAATVEGLYMADLNANLANYNNWKRSAAIPAGATDVISADGRLLGLYSASRFNPNSKGEDSVYYFDEQINDFALFQPLAAAPQTFYRFGPVHDKYFSVVDQLGMQLFNAQTGQFYFPLFTFNGEVEYNGLRDAVIAKDHTGNPTYWMAYNRFGLFQTYGAFPDFVARKMERDGMNRPFISMIDVFEGKVAVAPSLVHNAGNENFLREGINLYEDNEWSYFPCLDFNGTPIMDVTSVLIDRTNKNKIWATSWSYGLLEYENNKLIAAYTTSNLPMPQMIGTKHPRCSGLSQDRNGNIWFTHSDQSKYLAVLTKDKKYINFDFNVTPFTRKTFIDRNRNVWLLHERDGGITVFRPYNDNSNNINAVPTASVNFKILTNAVGSGNLQSNSVYAIAEDHDGRIWIGTSAGISVIYNPSAVLSSSEYDSQPIKIVQDGNVELLLGNETVTSIVVDGANNKWVGTLQGGVYCFSPDGINELYHFTKENSPLYSNTVVDLNYNEVTGDLFIGTEGGLQSYRGLIVKGEEQYSNVHAYPNPVKPNYQGSVLVRGLVDESIIKIVDESGNLVWETKSNGGQIEWPVKTLSGARVTSGVYVVYASTTDGELRALTKVLVVN